MKTTEPNFTPVGTIIAFAGEIEHRKEELGKEGWLVCNGDALSKTQYSLLFEAIGTNWGAPSEEEFNLPDFRGLFLRGANGSSGYDPDATERQAFKSGGNAGNLIGSYQGYATGKPHLPFRASIPNNNISNMKTDAGINELRAGAYEASKQEFPTNPGGGALESRPKNKYVFFLIKHSNHNSTNETVEIPIGSVIPFAGEPNQEILERFVLCNGEGFSNIGKFKLLFKAIGYSNGKAGEDVFNIPDYQGYFLRGVDDQLPDFRRDPNVEERTAPFPKNPEGARGNDKDKVGSEQQDATAYPVSAPFKTIIPALPTEIGGEVFHGGRNDIFQWNPDTAEADVATAGGDGQTCPVNFNIDWYIKCNF